MSSAAGSRARTLAGQEIEPEWTGREVAYGRKSPVLWASYDHASSSWRMSQVCLVALLSDQANGLAECSETWPRSGTMRNGIAYQLPPLAPLISETASGLLPTPVKYDATPGGPNNHYKGLGWSAKHSPTSLRWPTPRANDALKRGNFDLSNKRNGLAAAAKLWPTPNSRDWKDTTARSSLRAVDQGFQLTLGRAVHVSNPVSGALNPNWTEWLMGFPIGWTGLPHWATRSSLRSPSSSAARSCKRKG